MQDLLISIVKDNTLTDEQKIEKLLPYAPQNNNWLNVNASGKSLLHKACKNGGVVLAKWLLNINASLLHAVSDRKRNVLFQAVFDGNEALYAYFKALDPELLKSQNFYGGSLLHCAARSKSSTLMKEIFAEYGETFCKKDKGDQLPLHFAASAGLPFNIEFLAQWDKNFNVNVSNAEKKTSVHLAVENNKLENLYCLKELRSPLLCRYLKILSAVFLTTVFKPSPELQDYLAELFKELIQIALERGTQGYNRFLMLSTESQKPDQIDKNNIMGQLQGDDLIIYWSDNGIIMDKSLKIEGSIALPFEGTSSENPELIKIITLKYGCARAKPELEAIENIRQYWLTMPCSHPMRQWMLEKLQGPYIELGYKIHHKIPSLSELCTYILQNLEEITFSDERSKITFSSFLENESINTPHLRQAKWSIFRKMTFFGADTQPPPEENFNTMSSSSSSYSNNSS